MMFNYITDPSMLLIFTVMLLVTHLTYEASYQTISIEILDTYFIIFKSEETEQWEVCAEKTKKTDL